MTITTTALNDLNREVYADGEHVGWVTCMTLGSTTVDVVHCSPWHPVEADAAAFLRGYRAATNPYAPRVDLDDCAEVRSIGGDRAVYRFLDGVRAAKVAREFGVDLGGGKA